MRWKPLYEKAWSVGWRLMRWAIVRKITHRSTGRKPTYVSIRLKTLVLARRRDLFKDTAQTSSCIFPDKFQGLTAGLEKWAGWNGQFSRFPRQRLVCTEPVFVNLLRSPESDSQPGGIDSTTYLSYRPARLHRLAESIPQIDSWAP